MSYPPNVSRSVLECSVYAKIVDRSEGGHHHPVSTLLYAFKVTDTPGYAQPEPSHVLHPLSQRLSAIGPPRAPLGI